MVVGIDEAGRGPVIGPMIIAAVQISENKLKDLKDIKESKELEPEERWKILEKYLPLVEKIVIVVIFTNSIDCYTYKKQLNYLEYKIVKLISLMFKDEIIVDFPENIGKEKNILFIPKADKKYPIVALASIFAKIFRDYLIHLYHYQYGDFGSGYPSDPKTRKYLEKLIDLDLPIIRKSWKTVKNIVNKKKIKTLDEFL